MVDPKFLRKISEDNRPLQQTQGELVETLLKNIEEAMVRMAQEGETSVTVGIGHQYPPVVQEVLDNIRKAGYPVHIRSKVDGDELLIQW